MNASTIAQDLRMLCQQQRAIGDAILQIGLHSSLATEEERKRYVSLQQAAYALADQIYYLKRDEGLADGTAPVVFEERDKTKIHPRNQH